MLENQKSLTPQHHVYSNEKKEQLLVFNMDDLTSLQLYKSFQDPTSRLFLETNSNRLYQAAKEEASLFPVTHAEIDQFKRSVESISRSFESRTLKARRRHLQYRKWITYSPLNILLGKYRLLFFFLAGMRPVSHHVGRSVRRSIDLSHFAFFHSEIRNHSFSSFF